MSNMYWTFYPGKDYAKAMILLKRIDKAELALEKSPDWQKGARRRVLNSLEDQLDLLTLNEEEQERLAAHRWGK